MDRCPQCSAPLPKVGKFCGSCGADLEALVGSKTKPKTMLGMPAVGASGVVSPPLAKAPAAPSGFSPVERGPSSRPPSGDIGATMVDMKPLGGAADQKSTLFGMPAVVAPPSTPAERVPQAESPLAEASPAEVPAPSDRKSKSANRTVLGMAAVPPSGEVAKENAQPSKQRTMLGMMAAPPAQPAQAHTPQPQSPQVPQHPSIQTPPVQAHSPQAHSPQVQSQTAPPEPAPQAVSPGVSSPAPQTNRTMLGVAIEAPAAAAGTAPGAQTNRTMLGVAADGSTAAPAPQRSSRSSEDEVPVLPVRRKGGRWLMYALTGLLLLALTVVAGTLLLRGPDVQATVVPTGEGERLRIEVPGASPGTRLRFQGNERPLEAGRAEFPIGADALHIGENELSVDIVPRAGDVSTVPVRLELDYRVRADLSALSGESPVVRILIDAEPDATVTLDEAPIALDETGHAAVEFPLGVATTVFERTFNYRVVGSEGEADTGEVAVRVPIAALQVTSPSGTAITDRASVIIAGAVHSAASVLIDGDAVPVTNGHFSAERPLPSVGEHAFRIIARREGRVPRHVNLSVRRVENLRHEAESFNADRSLTYARLAASPNTYQNQRVSFVGRVFNVGSSPEGPMLQMVARDCPRGQRCPLWVHYDGATPVEMNQWVRVYGTASGEQQYRTSGGSVGRSPKVQAVIVLPERR